MPDFASAGKAIADRTCFRGFRLSQYEVLFRQTETYRPFSILKIRSTLLLAGFDRIAKPSQLTLDRSTTMYDLKKVASSFKRVHALDAVGLHCPKRLRQYWPLFGQDPMSVCSFRKFSRRCSVATRMIRAPRLGRLFVNGPEVFSHGISSVTRIEAGS